MEQNKPVYLVGADRVVLDDVTRFGLHRKHIVRTGGMPDVTAWQETYPQADVQVYMDAHGTGHLWIYWKSERVVFVRINRQ